MQECVELLCFLKNFGLLMHVDALSNGIVDFSLVFMVFAARRKSIMSEFTSVQKCVLFLVFFYKSGNDAASSNRKLGISNGFTTILHRAQQGHTTHPPTMPNIAFPKSLLFLMCLNKFCVFSQLQCLKLLKINWFSLHV